MKGPGQIIPCEKWKNAREKRQRGLRGCVYHPVLHHLTACKHEKRRLTESGPDNSWDNGWSGGALKIRSRDNRILRPQSLRSLPDLNIEHIRRQQSVQYAERGHLGRA